MAGRLPFEPSATVRCCEVQDEKPEDDIVLDTHVLALQDQVRREPWSSFVFLAKCFPSWPPSPEIRTAHAKFTDFLTF